MSLKRSSEHSTPHMLLAAACWHVEVSLAHWVLLQIYACGVKRQQLILA
jgi:hypothetical protein